MKVVLSFEGFYTAVDLCWRLELSYVGEFKPNHVIEIFSNTLSYVRQRVSIID